MKAQANLFLSRMVALAALAAAGRLLLVAIPGVSLSFLVLFITGVAFGVRMGAAVGATSRLVTDLVLSGVHPVFLVMVPVEAGLGAAFGLLGRFVDLGQRSDQPRAWTAGVAAAAGFLTTVVFSVAADTASWLLFVVVAPGVTETVAARTLGALVLAGLAFNAVPALVNTVLFAASASPILSALRQNGLLPLASREFDGAGDGNRQGP